MEQFKIDHFEMLNKHVSFPCFSSLSSAKSNEIQNRLRTILSLNQDCSDTELVSALKKRQHLFKTTNAEDDSFLLQDIVTSLGICPKNTVWINWYRFDQIDSMAFKDLCGFFRDIWYPSSDDIDIFDFTLSWFISISHDGVLRWAEF